MAIKVTVEIKCSDAYVACEKRESNYYRDARTIKGSYRFINTQVYTVYSTNRDLRLKQIVVSCNM